MSLPADIVERYKPIAEGAVLYGVPVSQMDKDELLAALGLALEQTRQLRESQAAPYL